MRSHRLAVLADVHGNVWALEAVLADIRCRGADEIVDFGDILYGPLDPAGSPHAGYALLTRETEGWHIEQILVPYPWKEAAARARRNGRQDWAEWIETGRARLS
jgi:hypothetical protein